MQVSLLDHMSFIPCRLHTPSVVSRTFRPPTHSMGYCHWWNLEVWPRGISLVPRLLSSYLRTWVQDYGVQAWHVNEMLTCPSTMHMKCTSHPHSPPPHPTHTHTHTYPLPIPSQCQLQRVVTSMRRFVSGVKQVGHLKSLSFWTGSSSSPRPWDTSMKEEYFTETSKQGMYAP